VRLVNHLEKPTGIHWHGAELANCSDGTPFTQNDVKKDHTLAPDQAPTVISVARGWGAHPSGTPTADSPSRRSLGILPDATEALSKQRFDRLDPSAVIGNGDLLPETFAALRAGAGRPRLTGRADGGRLEQHAADRLDLLGRRERQRRSHGR
jgi:hypothetical protein